jgi:hypothetical protein
MSKILNRWSTRAYAYRCSNDAGNIVNKVFGSHFHQEMLATIFDANIRQLFSFEHCFKVVRHYSVDGRQISKVNGNPVILH